MSNFICYKGIAKNIDTAINYIETHDLMALPKGKTIVDGDNVFINRDFSFCFHFKMIFNEEAKVNAV